MHACPTLCESGARTNLANLAHREARDVAADRGVDDGLVVEGEQVAVLAGCTVGRLPPVPDHTPASKSATDIGSPLNRSDIEMMRPSTTRVHDVGGAVQMEGGSGLTARCADQDDCQACKG
jgi:hypothetical protein